MSDQPAAPPAAAEASEIVQQMQTLVDVEAGLADAHMAVKAAEENPAGQDQPQATDAAAAASSNPAEAAAGAAGAGDASFLDAAEEVEDALESSIPAAPTPATASATTEPTPTLPGCGNADATASAAETEHVIEAVNADIPEPILPAQVTEPAHDVEMETAIEEETSPMQIDAVSVPATVPDAQTHATQETAEEEEEPRRRYDPSEPQDTEYIPPEPNSSSTVTRSSELEPVPISMPVRYDPSEPQSQGLEQEPAYDPTVPQQQVEQDEPVRAKYDPSEPQDTTPVSYDPSQPQEQNQPVVQAAPVAVDPHLAAVKQESSSPTQQHFSPAPSQAEEAKPTVNDMPPSTPYQPAASDNRPLADLPAGIDETSPSVVANQGWIRSWRLDTNNTHALLGLFNWSLQKSEVNDARAWYAVIAKDSPTAYQPLLSLIKLEQALNNFAQVEALFSGVLKNISGGIIAPADVELWKSYLHYVRRKNPVGPNDAASEARTTITQAYDLALQQCGTDRDAGEIWKEYLDFLVSAKAANEWEEQQKQDSLRKTYHKAVCIPLDNVEALWKAYDAFENGVNKQTAKKYLADRSPAYMTARKALRELRQLTDALPRPVIPLKPTFSDADRAAVAHWKAYLKWEEGNPLVIEDQTALATRIGYALRKCVGTMRHFPELWHYAANHYFGIDNKDEGVTVLKAGIEACPKSTLLTFAFADAEEERQNLAACHEAYQKLVEQLTAEADELKASIAAEVELARGPEIPNAAPNGTAKGNAEDPEISDQTSRLVEEREARGKMVEERRTQELDELRVAISVVWIMYMRFSRRAEGIKQARAIFGKTRRSPYITWHAYEASAMIEYHSNKEAGVAVKVFEVGLKIFAHDVDFVMRYLQFLLSINDDTNARALFEKSALTIPAEKARPLWDAWAKYEYMHGDLAAITKLKTRFAEVFPNDSPLKRFAQRFTYNGIDQIALRDLGFNARARAQSQQQQQQQGPPGLPPPASLPPHALPPPHAAASFQRPPSPAHKRPAPSRSPPPLPRIPRQSRSPSFGGAGAGNKRYRPSPSYDRAPPPPQRDQRDRSFDRDRAPPPQRSRFPSGGGPPPGPPARNSLPPQMQSGSPAPSMPGPDVSLDPSGLTNALTWFVGRLPSAQSFNGPVFRADDIVGLLDRHIGRDGMGDWQGPNRPPFDNGPQRYPPPSMGARRY